jgi:hypothetical protein
MTYFISNPVSVDFHTKARPLFDSSVRILNFNLSYPDLHRSTPKTRGDNQHYAEVSNTRLL